MEHLLTVASPIPGISSFFNDQYIDNVITLLQRNYHKETVIASITGNIVHFLLISNPCTWSIL